MSWTVPVIVSVGDTMSSSQWNAQARDNLKLTAPGIVTTAGDIFYGSGNHILNRLTIGTKYQILRANTSNNALEWATFPPAACIYWVGSSQGITSVGESVLTFDTEDYDYDTMSTLGTHNERLTCFTAGIYLITANVLSTITGGSPTGLCIFIKSFNSSSTLLNTWARSSSFQNLGADPGVPISSNLSCHVNLSVGDFIQLRAQTNTGTIDTVSGVNRMNCSLSALKVSL